jgi:hypothetical protein
MLTHAQSEALYNYARELRQCDVVIDPTAGEEWADYLRDFPASELPRAQLRHEYFGKDSEKAPLVLRVPLGHFDVLDALAGLAKDQATNPASQTRSVCGFIRSELPLDNLARRLEKNLSLRVVAQKIYFRYFDPRVMHHIPAQLASEALALHGVSSWGYFTWDGEWRTHAFPEGAPALHFSAVVRMSQEQWRPFETVEHFNATVSAFLRAGILWPSTETHRLRQMVATTLALGITEPQDVATYLLRSRQLEFPLAQDPRWSGVREFLDAGAPLAEVLDGLGLRAPAS